VAATEKTGEGAFLSAYAARLAVEENFSGAGAAGIAATPSFPVTVQAIGTNGRSYRLAALDFF
jgi:hypothetical protein